MSSSTPVRFGFIGAGQIAYFAADSILSHPQAELAAAHDLNAERLAAFCTEKGIPRSFATATELLADPDIDAVYIAVPNKFHAPLALEALEAGKHVILDKPFAMNLAEAREVGETARRTGLVFTLGMNLRYTEAHQKIRALRETGTFGDIYHARAYWFRRSGIPKLGTWFGNRELAGGGCLYDIGVHVLDLCLHTIGNFEPVSVFGSTYTQFGHRGAGEGGWGLSDRSNVLFDVDDFASALIKFSNGATVSLGVSWACHAHDHDRVDVEIFGSEAGASVSKGEIYRSGSGGREYEILQKPNVDIQFSHCDRFTNFINHILGLEPIGVTIDEALAVQAILDAIAESSVTGHEVRLDLR